MAFRVLASLCLAALLGSGPAAGSPHVQDGAPQMMAGQFRQGLERLKQWLEQRGEDRETVEVFIGAIENAFPEASGDGPVPVTRAAFEAFVDYERAWQRARKDAQDRQVFDPARLKEEFRKLEKAKRAFDRIAQSQCPEFYAAFKKAGAASRSHRAARGMGIGGGPGAGVFASRPTDGADAAVDTGVEALQQGDAARAIASADQAIAQNPRSAEAYALRAAADFDRQDPVAAAKDAQRALELDPDNPQAQAIAAMAAPPSVPGRARKVADASSLTGGAMDGAVPRPVGRESAEVAVKPGMMDLKDFRASAAQTNPEPSWAPLEPAALDRSPAAHTGYKGSLDLPIEVLNGSLADPDAYFDRAHDAAVQGDRAGMIQALRTAASLDPAYQPFLAAALDLDEGVTLTDLFVRDGAFGTVVRKRPWASRFSFSSSAVMIGAAAGLLLVLGAFLFGGKRRRAR